MWFCIGMYFFLGACAWMYFKKKSLFRKWDRLLRQIFFLMLAVTSLAFLSEIVQKTGTENFETMQIKRNGYGEGQKEAALSMQVEGEKKLWTGWIRIQKILTEKDGISTVELILVLVVIIGLVIIFKKQLNELVTKIFEKITNESSGI